MKAIGKFFSHMMGSSIQKKILFAFCVVLGVSITTAGLTSFLLVRSYAKTTANIHSEQVLSLVLKNIDSVIDSIENTSKLVLLSEDVIKYCQDVELMNEYERVSAETRLNQDFFAGTLRSNTLISSIVIYPASGHALAFGKAQMRMETDFSAIPVFKEGIVTNGPRWNASREVPAAYGKDKMISLTRQIRSADFTEVIGLLEVRVPEDRFSPSLRELEEADGSGVLLLDTAGQPVVAPLKTFEQEDAVYQAVSVQLQQNEQSAKMRIEGITYLLNCETLKNGWRLVYYQPMKNLTRTSDVVGVVILLSGALMLVVMFLLSGVLSRQLMKPLREAIAVIGSMDETEQPDHSDVEVAAIFNNYNLMMRRIRESELDTLRAQITPHFLYNTLNSIKCRALLDGNKNVAQMTQWLVNLLELSINNRNEYITLDGELDMLRSYVDLQQMRVGNLFTMEVAVTPPTLGECLIPKMILQTIVENAILHGLEEKESGGMVLVHALVEEHCLRIDVSDNGTGMSEDRIEAVLSGKENPEKRRMNRIGLYNVDQRIKLYFGKAYGISIQSAPGEGTCVTIVMPQEKDPEQFRGVKHR